MLTRRGCEIPKSVITVGVLEDMRRELRVMPLSTVGTSSGSFEVWAQTPTRYIVPRFWAGAKGVSMCNVMSEGDEADIGPFCGTLRPDQVPLVEKVEKSLDHAGGCVLCARTGQGKTAMALYVASTLQKKTVVVVHKSFLATQWIDRAATFVPSACVTKYGDGSLDFSGDIVVATIQTLLSRGIPSEWAESTGIVIFDEVHRIAAPSFSQVLMRCGLNAPRLLGLSATPDRADGLTRVIHWLCGPLLETESGGGQHPPGTDVRIVRPLFRGEIMVPQNRRGDVDHARLLNMLSEDPVRTAFLVQTITQHVDRERDCLILSHRRAHCTLLATKLQEEGYECATYLGGDKRGVPSSKVIISTYTLVSEGFDEPRLSALVFATPASNIVQAMGRILRRPGPKVIVDLLDENPVCYAQASKRKKQYVHAGFLIHSNASKSDQYMFRVPCNP